MASFASTSTVYQDWTAVGVNDRSYSITIPVNTWFCKCLCASNRPAFPSSFCSLRISSIQLTCYAPLYAHSHHIMPRFSFSSLFPNMCAASNTIFFILWYRQLLLLFKHHQQINQLFFFCISNQFISYSGATVWWWCKGKCGMIDAITDVRIGSTCCGMPNK